jgi:hypothetical protein
MHARRRDVRGACQVRRGGEHRCSAR